MPPAASYILCVIYFQAFSGKVLFSRAKSTRNDHYSTCSAGGRLTWLLFPPPLTHIYFSPTISNMVTFSHRICHHGCFTDSKDCATLQWRWPKFTLSGPNVSELDIGGYGGVNKVLYSYQAGRSLVYSVQ